MIYSHPKELNKEELIAIITLFPLMGPGNKTIKQILSSSFSAMISCKTNPHHKHFEYF